MSATVGSARRLALDALARIEDDGAYANLVVPQMLRSSRLPTRERHFVTELVYGITRMRRALDVRIDQFARGPLDAPTRRVLRLGAFQLAHLRVPAHAAVSETVALAPLRSRRFVNAVLRRLAVAPEPPWPNDAARLSYPDWVADRLTEDLGAGLAMQTLTHLNERPTVNERDDGYVQDRGSQWVVEQFLDGLGASPRIVDLCAAPGGKSTAMAAAGAFVMAIDRRPHRVDLVVQNALRLGLANRVLAVVADGLRPPVRAASADAVLVDAPCSGLGVLHRRPDARWRIEPGDIDDLADLQRGLLSSASGLVRPGGRLAYSVCTLTRAESTDIDEWMAVTHPELAPLHPPGSPWQAWGRGARLLPQSARTDGMCLFQYVKITG